MKTKTMLLTPFLAIGLALSLHVRAEEPSPPNTAITPVIPPSVSTISPAGMQRGSMITFTIEGRNLSNATEVIFDAPGISGKVTQIADVPEQIAAPRAGEDLGAQVPLGKKQTAKLEITVAKDALAGVHRFRIQTPLGTTNTIAFAVGTLPEIMAQAKTSMDAATVPATVTLPATLIGNIAAPGDKDTYQFEGKAGEEIVFQVLASQLGSRLQSLLALSDNTGKILAEAGKSDPHPDVALHYQLTKDGKYTIAVTDRDRAGGNGYYYRLNAGPLPYITDFFPIGVRAGEAAEGESTTAIVG
jgi:hypothetical protein